MSNESEIESAIERQRRLLESRFRSDYDWLRLVFLGAILIAISAVALGDALAVQHLSGHFSGGSAIFGGMFTPRFRSANEPAVSSVVAMFKEIDAQGYAGCCAAIRNMDMRPILRLIATPTSWSAGPMIRRPRQTTPNCWRDRSRRGAPNASNCTSLQYRAAHDIWRVSSHTSG
jgi:hypothetical protein